MKATVEEINSVQRRVSITIPSEKVNDAFENSYKSLQKKARVQGFRPGKAPLYLIKKMYGENVAAEVSDALIKGNLYNAIQEHGVSPVAPPYVEAQKQPEQNTEYHFVAIVDVMPNLEIGDSYKSAAFTAKKFEVGPNSLERELKRVARRQAKISDLPEGTAAALNHLVTFSHQATLEGKNLPEFDVKDVSIALGFEEIFKDLEDAILGMKTGEEKAVAIVLPKEYGTKELAGQKLDFTIHLTKVQALEIPAIDDELAKDINYESLEDLKARIVDHLNNSAADMSKRELESALFNKLIDANNFEIPPAIVDQVIDSMIDEVQLPKDQLVIAKKDAEIRKSMRAEAKRKAQNTVYILEVIKNEKLSVSDDEIKAHMRTLGKTGAAVTDEQIDRDFAKFSSRLRETLIFDKAIQFIVDQSQIDFETVVI